jgi:hypothetical protein
MRGCEGVQVERHGRASKSMSPGVCSAVVSCANARMRPCIAGAPAAADQLSEEPEVLPERPSPAAAAMRRGAYRLLLFGCRSSGAAFIKWGQWSATRGDMFPQARPH